MKLLIFFCDLFIPLGMAVAGWMFLRHPPKKIQRGYGYRSARSTKSPEAWAFAHQYCGKLWFNIGLVMLPISALIHLPFLHSDIGAFGWMSCALVTVQGIIMVGSMFPVERALKRKFGDK